MGECARERKETWGRSTFARMRRVDTKVIHRDVDKESENERQKGKEVGGGAPER